MRVTDIKQQVKRTDRYSVFVDGRFVCGLSEHALLESGLRVHQQLDEAKLEELKAFANETKVYDSTLALLARRPRSTWEIESYLKRKKIDEPIIQATIAKLTERHLLDDKEFARSWVHSRRLLKQTSRRKLMLELRQKRVADETIQEVLAADKTDEKAVLKDLIVRKQTQTRYKDKTKLMQYLTRQGFSYGDVKEAFEELASS